METVKLTNKKGDIIERLKIQYEPNVDIWTRRGWSLYEEKPKPQPKVEVKTETKPEPKVESEWQKPIESKKPKPKKVE
tara:strand:+ start:466 stop:699 length:234 start_codon:yes stop_codon:yes gene_type:complete